MLHELHKFIPGTNNEMTEGDAFELAKKMEAKDNLKYLSTLPLPERAIQTLVMIKQGTKDELIEENRKLYAAKEWEQYI